MPDKKDVTQISFPLWIKRQPENRLYLMLTVTFIILAFGWLKWYYPYPNFLPDSYSYLDAAFKNVDINIWPIGYSVFLRLFSCLTRSDTALVFFQYSLLQASILYFSFTVKYLIKTGKWLTRVLLVLSIANPLSLFISNFISSDSLFAAISLIWFTQLLWILYRPNIPLLILHAFVLTVAFSIRYNALYYPLISVALIGWISMPTTRKFIAIGSIILLLGGFIGNSLYQYRQMTGTNQFSAFGGWQLASNALFAYAHSPHDVPQAVPKNFKQLQLSVDRHMDSLHKLTNRPDNQLGIYYLWNDHAPLKQYLALRWKKDTVTDGFKKWAVMGPIYSAYGSWLIRQHPMDFIRYYIWPNMISYYVPKTEFLGIYNMGKDSVENMAQFWFAYKTPRIMSRNKIITAVNIYPTLLAIINVLFIFSLIAWGVLQGVQTTHQSFARALSCMMLVWLANFCFSVLASPIVLRYQLFPMIITLTFLCLLLEFLIRSAKAESNTLKSVVQQ